jgi:flagellar L-ring protein precursor FlgH
MMSMKKIFIIFLTFLFAGCSTYIEETINAEFTPLKPSFEEFKIIPASNGSIYSGSSAGLFSSDRRAHKVGDILTVTLNETFSSSKSVTTASSKADAIGANVGPTGVLRNFAGLGASASKTNSFAGSGSAAQSNSLTGFLSVTVVRVFPNGNLEIKGQKKLRLTEGSEYIRINGIVRPQDISATNYVSSSQIAEAQIEYVGAGSLANEARPGWGSRLFRALAPF